MVDVALVRIIELPENTAPQPTDYIATDNGATDTLKVQLGVAVNRVIPVATHAQIDAGTDTNARITPEGLKYAIDNIDGSGFATAAQGAKADTAVQPDRRVDSGTGLTGGGDLSANRTIALSPASQASLAKADTSLQPARRVDSGTGLTGGGDLSADRTIALSAASQASLAKADTSVQPARNITAGTGLTGGGNLSADRTIALDLTFADGRYQERDEKGLANGYPSLGPDGKIPTSQLPDAVLGGLQYQGTWNASTNTPAIPPASAANKGWYYVVSVAGNTNIGGVTEWDVGDWIISDGTTWAKLDNSDSVVSVAGKTGAVTLVPADVVGLPAALDSKLDDSQASAFGLTLLDDPDAAAARTTLGLGTAATQPSTAFAPASHVGAGGTAHAAATTTTAGFMSSADKTKLDGIAAGAQVNTVTSVAGKTGAVSLVKGDVGLGNVDNTSDLNKPISTATQAALDDKLDDSQATPFGLSLLNDADAAAGRTTLGLGTAATQPSTAFAPAAHVGAGGTAHAAATTAAAGFMSAADKSKLDGIAAGAGVQTVSSVNSKTGAVVLVKADVGLGNVDNTSDLNKPISTATQTALNAKLDDSQASAFGLTLLDDPDAAAARTTLGLGTAATAAATDFASSGAALVDSLRITRSYSLPGGTDFDTILTGGFYNISSPVNSPDGPTSTIWWYLQVQRHSNSDSYATQTAQPLNSAGGARNNEFWFRSRYSAAWGPWIRMTNTADLIPMTAAMLRSEIATSKPLGNVIDITGETALADYGFGARYVRGTSGGLRAVQDANGVWWNLQLLGVEHVHSGWFGQTYTAVQAAIDAAASTGINSVFVAPGVINFAAAMRMRPNVRVWANRGATTIRQNNGANLPILIDFNTLVASGARLDGFIVDGNRANNAFVAGTDRFMIHYGAANSVTVRDNELMQFGGHAVYGTSGLNPEVTDNYIHHCNGYGFYVNQPNGAARNAPIFRRNRMEAVNWHAIALIKCSDSRVEDNDIIGRRVTGVRVNVSGTTVTWVSGPNFADIEPGNFIIYDGGKEALVTAKASNTSLTINFAAGNGTNVPASLGSADMVGSWSSTNTRIARNMIKVGASLGVSVFSDQATTGASDVGCIVEENTIEGMGSAGLSVQSSGTGRTVGTRFRNNEIIDCGQNGTAADPNFNFGAGIQGAVTDIVLQGNGFTVYNTLMPSINILSPDLAQVRTADNRSKGSEGYTNAASVGAFTGWGTGATCVINQVSDNHILLTVTSGTGVSANPSITIQHKTVPVSRKQPRPHLIGTNGAILPFTVFLPDAATETAIVMSGTPGNSTTYYIVVDL